MTAQINDGIKYNGTEYSIVGIDGDGLFDPFAYGMNPVSWCTACWRGFVTDYEVENGQLFLDTLKICLTEPSLGDVKRSRRWKPLCSMVAGLSVYLGMRPEKATMTSRTAASNIVTTMSVYLYNFPVGYSSRLVS